MFLLEGVGRVIKGKYISSFGEGLLSLIFSDFFIFGISFGFKSLKRFVSAHF